MTIQRRAVSGDRRERRRVALKLAPLLVFFALTVGLGLVHGLLQSFSLAGPSLFALRRGDMGVLYAYRELLTRPEFLASLLHSLFVSGVSAVISVVFGAVAAYLLWRGPRWFSAAASVYRLPIILPHIVVAFLTVLFWSQSGVIASVFHALNIDVGEPGFPPLLFSRNGIGMILAYIYKEFPFVMLLTLGVLQRIPERMVTTARMLGAGPVRVFFSVVLPLILPILNQTFIILFLFALGGFDIPWLLGASNPQMIPMTVYSLYFQGQLTDRPIAMAALTLLAATAVVFVLLYSRLARRFSAWERPL